MERRYWRRGYREEWEGRWCVLRHFIDADGGTGWGEVKLRWLKSQGIAHRTVWSQRKCVRVPAPRLCHRAATPLTIPHFIKPFTETCSCMDGRVIISIGMLASQHHNTTRPGHTKRLVVFFLLDNQGD